MSNPADIGVTAATIGDWDDSHPLNKRDTADAEIARLFS